MSARRCTLVLVCIAACSDDAPVESPPVDPLADLRAACGELAEVWCSSAAECLRASFAAEYASPTSCVERRRELCERTKLGHGSRADAARIRACAAASRPVESTPLDERCAEWLRGEVGRLLPDACTPEGTLEDGATCLVGGQCQRGGCLRVEAPRATCGVCGTPVGPGGACGVDGDCEPSHACVGGSCVAYLGLGPGCGPSAPCHPDLACVGGSCVGRSGERGAQCEPGTGSCALWPEQLACDPASATCQPIVAGLAQGVACADDPHYVPQAGPCYWGTLPAEYCQAGIAVESLCAHGLGCAVLVGHGTCVPILDDDDSCSVTNPNVSYLVGPCAAPAECLDGRCQIPDTGACGEVPP